MQVQSCQVSPNSIALGGTSTLFVTLDGPAPPGGITVIISSNFNGSMDTVSPLPQSLPVQQGTQSASALLQTVNIPNAATAVTFTAFLYSGGVSKSATLEIR
jgi:hypothetical protein